MGSNGNDRVIRLLSLYITGTEGGSNGILVRTYKTDPKGEESVCGFERVKSVNVEELRPHRLLDVTGQGSHFGIINTRVAINEENMTLCLSAGVHRHFGLKDYNLKGNRVSFGTCARYSEATGSDALGVDRLRDLVKNMGVTDPDTITRAERRPRGRSISRHPDARMTRERSPSLVKHQKNQKNIRGAIPKTDIKKKEKKHTDKDISTRLESLKMPRPDTEILPVLDFDLSNPDPKMLAPSDFRDAYVPVSFVTLAVRCKQQGSFLDSLKPINEDDRLTDIRAISLHERSFLKFQNSNHIALLQFTMKEVTDALLFVLDAKGTVLYIVPSVSGRVMAAGNDYGFVVLRT